MGNGFLVDSYRWVTAGIVVGLYHLGMGWILGLGPRREFCSYAVAGYDRLCTFHHGAKKTRYVSNVEHGPCDNQFYTGSIRYVYQQGRPSSFSALVCGINNGLDILGSDGLDSICVAGHIRN